MNQRGPGLTACIAALALLPRGQCPVAAAPAAALQAYRESGYVVHTDLGASEREIALRLEAMALAFRQHAAEWGDTADAAGPAAQVFLFRSSADYRAAGGPAGSAGIFLPDAGDGGGTALVLVGPRFTLATWHTLQHEAFHAYVHATIDRQHASGLPPWLEEGLADYFGEALFSGDAMVSGLVPPWRLARLRGEMAAGQLQPLGPLLALSLPQWRAVAGVAGYDQAWSLVHFLLHGEHETYRAKLADFVRTGSADALGPLPILQQRWQHYWMTQPANPTAAGYTLVVAQTINAFRVRAASTGQPFDSYQRFRAAAAAGQVIVPEAHWLPASMLSEAIEAADSYGSCSFLPQHDSAGELTVSRGSTRIAAGYTLQPGGTWKLWSRVDLP